MPGALCPGAGSRAGATPGHRPGAAPDTRTRQGGTRPARTAAGRLLPAPPPVKKSPENSD